MDFFAGLGAKRRHNMAYGNDEQRRHAEKDTVLRDDSCVTRH
jgi:hypothetical protein